MEVVRSLVTKKIFWLIPYIILYAIWVSTPILLAGYFSDDVTNGVARGIVQLQYHSIWDLTRNTFKMWIESGRFFPFSVLIGYPFYYLFPTIFVYQLARVIVIWLSLISVAWLVKLLSKQIEAAFLVLFMLPMFWSIRNYHDPLTSFTIMLSCVTLFSILTLCFFIKAIETQKKYYTFLSLLCYALALTTYEIGVTAFFALAVLVWIRSGSIKKFIFYMMPYGFVTTIYLIIVICLHHSDTHGVYEGIKFGSLMGLWHALPDQLISGLPLSYWLFAPKRYFALPLLSPYFSIGSQVLPALVLAFISLWPIYFLLKKISFQKKAQLTLLSIGAVFVFFPAFIISLSKRYQTEIHFGVGYLPVYMEYVGFAIILFAMFNYLNAVKWTHYKTAISFTLASLFSLMIGFSFFLNHYTVRVENNWEQNPRELVEYAVKAGLLSDLPSSVAFAKVDDRWIAPEFFMQLAGLKASVIELNEQHKKFLVNYYCFPDSSYGYVIMARLQAASYHDTDKGLKVDHYTVINPKVFLFSGRRKFLGFSGQEVRRAAVIAELNARLLPRPFQQVSAREIRAYSGKEQGWVIINLPSGVYQLQPSR